MVHFAAQNTHPDRDLMADVVLDQSYRNFHAKGLDYLCLKRTPDHTVKVYFFDGDADLSALPEVVMPHDHRYDFRSVCIAGEVTNKEYSRCSRGFGKRYDRFLWDTPLNGGGGFSYAGEEFLTYPHEATYHPGSSWMSGAKALHTLRIDRAGTIVRLDQYADTVPLGVPTHTFRQSDAQGDVRLPSLAGLYDTMSSGHAEVRLRQYRDALDSLSARRAA